MARRLRKKTGKENREVIIIFFLEKGKACRKKKERRPVQSGILQEKRDQEKADKSDSVKEQQGKEMGGKPEPVPEEEWGGRE